jgi:phosphoribosylaminoimidazolecarboxamide formyltransferase/IMP cyclohydrolase
MEEMACLLFAWKICKHVKSNAIVYARNGRPDDGGGRGADEPGGCGALWRDEGGAAAGRERGCFGRVFPFADGLETVVAEGATAVIQPGGSVRDAEVIAAADRLGVAMVFTGMRHFRH